MTDPSHEQIERIAELMAGGESALLTGAGVSTDSGLPDYRGAGTPPRRPMDIAEFMTDPAYRRRFWAGARVGAMRWGEILPNAGHLAITRLETAGLLTGVLTQNVDGLHRSAGTSTLVELHGRGSVIRCVTCTSEQTRTATLEDFDRLNPGFALLHADAEIAPDGDALVSDVDEVLVPHCPVCGGILRPDVVYFGELVPREVFTAAARIVEDSSALIVAGSSLAVNTGVRLLRQAQRAGLPVIVINRGPTKADAAAAVRIHAGTTETLSALAERLIL